MDMRIIVFLIGIYFVSSYTGDPNGYNLVTSFILGLLFAMYCAVQDALHGTKWYWFSGPKKGEKNERT